MGACWGVQLAWARFEPRPGGGAHGGVCLQLTKAPARIPCLLLPSTTISNPGSSPSTLHPPPSTLACFRYAQALIDREVAVLELAEEVRHLLCCAMLCHAVLCHAVVRSSEPLLPAKL